MSLDIVILYGSQTGNAEDMAKRIGQKAKSRGFRVLVEAMDDFPLRMLRKYRFILFVCSTTGHGQEPENMKNFYNFIRRRDLPRGCLSDLRYAVYGLGDSSYAKFNYISKILFKRLQECGGEPIQDLVIGDEQHQFGCDGAIYPGLEELWHRLGGSIIGQPEIGDLYSPQLESSYSLKICNANDSAHVEDVFNRDFITKYNMKEAFCTRNERLTPPSHFQDTRFLSFNTIEQIKYEPGDVCTILPTNSDKLVQEFIDTLGLDPNQRFKIRKKDKGYMVNYLYDFIPDGLRVRDLVKYYLDIQSIPKRSFFEYLWPFSDNELEKDKLREFSSTEGQEELYEYCIQPKRNILEVLLDFTHTVKNIKFEYLFDLIPPIKPRSFSIASAPILGQNQIQLIVGVVNYQTRMRKTRKGLCSNYLAMIKPVDSLKDAGPDSKLRFFVKNSSFKLPANNTTPIIMIGPGLGIAPFRSFIQQRAALVCSPIKKDQLYFGCRFAEADFYFRDELEQYGSSELLRIQVAFSREGKKQYVQDLLIEDSDLISEYIKYDNAIVYVAGNSKLPEDLRKLLQRILFKSDGDTEECQEAEKLIVQLEAQGRIQYDCW